MNVITFSDASRQEWDNVCDSSEQAWLFHRSEWVRIEEQHFVRKNLAFAVVVGGRVIGICPLYLSDSGTGTGGERLLHTGVHRHTGPAFRAMMDEGEMQGGRRLAMNHILKIGEELDVDRIQLNSHNLAPQNLCAEREEIPFWVMEYGFDLGLAFGPCGMTPVPGSATCNADQIVDLQVSEESLFQRLDESCRRAIRKAMKTELQLSPSTEESDCDDYYRLAELSANRTGEILPSKEYYRDILRGLASQGNAVLLFVKHEGKNVAALLLLLYKGSTSFLTAVSDTEYLPMRINDFLHWKAMLWAKDAGFTRYRLGPWFPSVNSDWPIATVSKFKSKFGGRSATILQGSLFRRPEKFLANGESLLQQLCGRTNQRSDHSA